MILSIRFRHYDVLSLVAKTILAAAIRTCPGNGITRHPPHVFLHAILTDAEPAATRPAKRKFHPTAITIILSEATSFFAVCGSGGRRFHDCCFKALVL